MIITDGVQGCVSITSLGYLFKKEEMMESCLV